MARALSVSSSAIFAFIFVVTPASVDFPESSSWPRPPHRSPLRAHAPAGVDRACQRYSVHPFALRHDHPAGQIEQHNAGHGDKNQNKKSSYHSVHGENLHPAFKSVAMTARTSLLADEARFPNQ